jgi:UDP-N-acetylglucosamine 2-epimerase (non-hydrolysing)
LVETFADIQVVFPVHLNPQVQAVVHEVLGGVPRVVLTDPLDYRTFLALQLDATLILTDSGGFRKKPQRWESPCWCFAR